MIYFKKVQIDNCSHDMLEVALRKVSVKRTSPLDIVSTSTDIGTDKLFLGHEGKNTLTFTRLRASFERILPKLIIRLSPNQNDCSYDIRFSILSTCVFVLIAVSWAINLILLMFGQNSIENFLPYTFFVGIYFSLVFLELRLTTGRVNKALNLFNNL